MTVLKKTQVERIANLNEALRRLKDLRRYEQGESKTEMETVLLTKIIEDTMAFVDRVMEYETGLEAPKES